MNQLASISDDAARRRQSESELAELRLAIQSWLCFALLVGLVAVIAFATALLAPLLGPGVSGFVSAARPIALSLTLAAAVVLGWAVVTQLREIDRRRTDQRLIRDLQDKVSLGGLDEEPR
ncbi:MAG: hypothetical protein ABW203_05630 [Novosphingobium sp.]